jgi:hypothetical protein
VPIDEARQLARELLGKLVAGIDPTQPERQAVVPTLRVAVADYLERDLRESTRKWYRYWSTKWLGDWLELPIVEITELMGITRNKGIDLPNSDKPAKNQTNGGKTQMAQVMTFLKAVLNYAKNRYKNEDFTKILSTNPCAILTEFKEQHRIAPRKNFVSASQLPANFVAVRQLEQIEKAYELAQRNLPRPKGTEKISEREDMLKLSAKYTPMFDEFTVGDGESVFGISNRTSARKLEQLHRARKLGKSGGKAGQRANYWILQKTTEQLQAEDILGLVHPSKLT